MKKKKRPSTYCRIAGGVFRPYPVTYTKRDARKLCMGFPEKSHAVILEEITRQASILMGRKCSGLTAQSINRKNTQKKIRNLRESLQSVKDHYGNLNRSAEPHAFKIKKALYKLTSLRYATKLLNELPLSILWMIRACDAALAAEDRPGIKHQHYLTAVQGLAAIWTKYKGKKPTRHCKMLPGAPGTAGGIQHKDGGPFIDFVTIALKPAAPHQASIPHLAKTVIRSL